MKPIVIATLLLAALASPARAQVEVRDHRRGPTVVRVRVAPPAPRAEVRVQAPSRRHVWIPGYWSWNGRRHLWVAGRWMLPPAEHRVWVEPRWVSEGGEWVFTPGSWAEGGVETYVIPSQPAPPPQPQPPVVVVAPPPEQAWEVEVAPPPPRREVIPRRPGRHYVWVAGYWGWTGTRHEWVAGHWEPARRGHARWVPGRWVRHGHRWKWKPGRWR